MYMDHGSTVKRYTECCICIMGFYSFESFIKCLQLCLSWWVLSPPQPQVIPRFLFLLQQDQKWWDCISCIRMKKIILKANRALFSPVQHYSGDRPSVPSLSPCRWCDRGTVDTHEERHHGRDLQHCIQLWNCNHTAGYRTGENGNFFWQIWHGCIPPSTFSLVLGGGGGAWQCWGLISDISWMKERYDVIWLGALAICSENCSFFCI